MVSESKVVEFPIGDTYLHEYRLRRSGKRSRTVEVSVPPDFIKRLIRNSGLDPEEFFEKCKVIVYYGGGNDLLYTFQLNGEKVPE